MFHVKHPRNITLLRRPICHYYDSVNPGWCYRSCIVFHHQDRSHLNPTHFGSMIAESISLVATSYSYTLFATWILWEGKVDALKLDLFLNGNFFQYIMVLYRLLPKTQLHRTSNNDITVHFVSCCHVSRRDSYEHVMSNQLLLKDFFFFNKLP